jgi:hypothetical protein
METQTRYTYLEQRPDKRTAGTLYSGDWGADVDDLVRSLYLSRMTPQQIAQNRDLPMAAILEALAYWQDHWEVICAEKDAERAWLDAQGFFAEDSSARR